MTEMLKQADKRVVGSKQVLRALNEDRAARVFLGRDADGFIYHRINGLCEEKRVPVTVVDSMQELGKLCTVDVKTALKIRSIARWKAICITCSRQSVR